MPDQFVNYITAGVGVNATDKVRIDAAIAHSDADAFKDKNTGVTSSDKTAYLLRATYGQADFSKVGSYDAYVMYRKSPQLASYSDTDDWVKNVKGFRIGGDYVVAENMSVTAWATLGKDVDTDETSNMYRLQLNFVV